jgi:predicted 2-oxoglutarate/Fe(II)-dependent dioxygenase YbiX
MRHDIFPIHYYQTQINENESLKQKYLSAILETYQNEHIGSPCDWVTDRMHSSFNHSKLNQKIFANDSELKQMYLHYLNEFMDAQWKGVIDNLWFNCYIDGDYQEPHNHVDSGNFIDSNFSCIHYLAFNQNQHQPVIFCDPSEQLRLSGFELHSHHYSGEHAPDIMEGDLLMFPSYLQHYVAPCKKTIDYPRVTISFNVRLLSYNNFHN